MDHLTRTLEGPRAPRSECAGQALTVDQENGELRPDQSRTSAQMCPASRTTTDRCQHAR